MRVRVRREGLFFSLDIFQKDFFQKKQKKTHLIVLFPRGLLALNRGALDQDGIYADEHQVGVWVEKKHFDLIKTKKNHIALFN